MAVIHERGDGDGSANAAMVAIFLVALIVILAILFYGLGVAHLFGAGNTTIINPAASGAPSIAASAAASASASVSGSP